MGLGGRRVGEGVMGLVFDMGARGGSVGIPVRDHQRL